VTPKYAQPLTDCDFCESETQKIRDAEAAGNERSADVHQTIYEGHLHVQHGIETEEHHERHNG
jgi:hypothetical protein